MPISVKMAMIVCVSLGVVLGVVSLLAVATFPVAALEVEAIPAGFNVAEANDECCCCWCCCDVVAVDEASVVLAVTLTADGWW